MGKVLKSVFDKQKTILITVKVSAGEHDRIKARADKWAGGNLSEWVRYASAACEPRDEDLIDESSGAAEG